MAKRTFNYGWIVVATSFIFSAVAFAIPAYFTIFFKPLQETFGWSRAIVSWAMTIQLLAYSLFILPAGWAIDRLNARVIYSVAGLLIGASLILCSQISQPWHLYVLYGLPLGIGLGVCGPANMAIVTRWFTERRGLALGIASAGIGFGTFIGAPVANSLIIAHGWQTSTVLIGATSCVLILICAYFIKASPPGGPGLRRPEGRPEPQTGKPLSPPGMTLRQALRTREMFLLLLAQVPAVFTLRVIQVHFAPHAIDLGISPSVAALLVSTIGSTSIIGRVTMGFAQDKVGAQYARIMCLAAQGIAMLALPFVTTDMMFFAYAILFGFTYGGDVPQGAALTAQCFGLLSIGALYGLLMAVGNLAGALGPIVAGQVFDTTGSYNVVFLATGASLFLSAFCIWRLRPKASITPSV